jgi:hypothetical protein
VARNTQTNVVPFRDNCFAPLKSAERDAAIARLNQLLPEVVQRAMCSMYDEVLKVIRAHGLGKLSIEDVHPAFCEAIARELERTSWRREEADHG